MEARKFFLDTATRRFVGSADSSAPSTAPVFFSEDIEEVVLHFLKPTGVFASPYEYVDYSAYSVKFGAGVTSAAALQTTWSAVSTTVTPTVTSLTAGGSGQNEVQKVTFSQRPASGSFSLQFPSRSVTVASVASSTFTAADHGLFDGQVVTLSAFTTPTGFNNSTDYYVVNRTKDTFKIAATSGGTALTVSVASGGGTATISAITTRALAYNSSAANWQDAIISAGLTYQSSPAVIVTSSSATEFTLTYANGMANRDYANVTVTGSTLAAAPGLTANVNFNTSEIVAILAAGQGGDLFMEVEVSDGTGRQTWQQPATVSSDIIDSATASAVALTTASGFVLMSPDGTVWEIGVDDDGLLQSAATVSTSAPSGLSMRSPNGTAYTLSVDNDGLITTTAA